MEQKPGAGDNGGSIWCKARGWLLWHTRSVVCFHGPLFFMFEKGGKKKKQKEKQQGRLSMHKSFSKETMQ